MQMPALADGWEPTRLTLQKYSHAMTALPRAAAEPDRRWSHVALDPVEVGGAVVFRSAPTPLEDGAQLISSLDIAQHRITVTAGHDVLHVDLLAVPSPTSVGSLILDLAVLHGTVVDVDSSRYASDLPHVYDADHATRWYDNSVWVVDTFYEFNDGLEGEIAGPHLWPHGFDIATEWFSPRVLDDGANPQIIVGFYPEGESYFYVNPWPFESDWADAPLPGESMWHVEGWQGAMVKSSDLGADGHRRQVLDLAGAVHELTRSVLL